MLIRRKLTASIHWYRIFLKKENKTMRSLILIVSVLLLSVQGWSQVTPRPIKANIKTPQAKCADCKTKIETIVPKSVDGLVKIYVNISQGVTTVQYYPDRTNIEELKTAISNVGFDADDVLANPDMYKKLPACCKKPEDQGFVPPKKN
jgi:copper chaperone CopZ